MTRVSLILAVVILMVWALPAYAVNGILEIHDGQQVLHVWGTNYEMGYAHGYLLADQIMAMMRVYAFPPPDAGTALYEAARLFVLNNFAFEEDLTNEAQGLYDGMLDAGIPTYVDVLQRDFDVDDVLTYIGLADLNSLFCATVIGWNTTTVNDGTLNGLLAATHNTDYVREREDPWLAARCSVLLAMTPSDPNQQPFLSLTLAGMPGIIAGINEQGIGLYLNKGRVDVPYEELNLDPLPEPGPWLTRKALALRDFDGDEINTIEDVFAFFEEENHFSSSMYQVFGPTERSDPPAGVLEINNKERTVAYPDDDPTLTDCMVTLNWEDKLSGVPTGNYAAIRYNHSRELINETYGGDLLLTNMWDFLHEMQLHIPLFPTMQSMILIPDLMRLAIAFSDETGTAPNHDPVWHDIEDLFLTPAVDDDTAPDDDVVDDDTDDDTTPDDDDDDDNDQADDDDDDNDDGCGCS